MLRAMRILTSLIVPLVAAGIAGAQTPPKTAAGGSKSPPKAAPAESNMPTSQSMNGPPAVIGGKGLGQWAKDLESKDPEIRELAVRTIPYFGRPALIHIPKLIDRLAVDKEYNVRFAALLVLSQNPIEDEKQRADIVRHIINDDGLLRSVQVPMRTQAAIALMGYGREARGAIDMLTGDNYLRFQHSFELRMASAAALASIGQRDPKLPQLGPDMRAVMALVNQLNDPCLRVRDEVAKAFMVLGRPAKPEDWIKEKLILLDRINTEPDAVQKNWLRAALVQLDGTEEEFNKQIGAISGGLYSDKQDIRLAAAQAIGMFGAKSKGLVGHLLKSIHSVENSQKQDDVDFLYMCVWAIGSIGPEAKKEKEALPVLQKMTKHQNQLVKETAEKAVSLVNK